MEEYKNMLKSKYLNDKKKPENPEVFSKVNFMPRTYQKQDVKGLLGWIRSFESYGPEDPKIEYHKRPFSTIPNRLLTQIVLFMVLRVNLLSHSWRRIHGKMQNMRNRSCFTQEKMGYGRQSRQNRKENPARNWTFRLHKMQKNLPHHPKQKEDLRMQQTDGTSTPSIFSR